VILGFLTETAVVRPPPEKTIRLPTEKYAVLLAGRTEADADIGTMSDAAASSTASER
jgi:hypothetical protein